MTSPKPKWRKCLAFVPTSKRVLSNAHAEISLVVVLIVLVIPESEAMVSDFDLNAHSIQVDIFLEEEAK